MTKGDLLMKAGAPMNSVLILRIMLTAKLDKLTIKVERAKADVRGRKEAEGG
jgi:hypothetical protein